MDIGLKQKTMKKITAVEWLYKISQERELKEEDFYQAQEMSKSQIMTAYIDGVCNTISKHNNQTMPEQYFETNYYDI